MNQLKQKLYNSKDEESKGEINNQLKSGEDQFLAFINNRDEDFQLEMTM